MSATEQKDHWWLSFFITLSTLSLMLNFFLIFKLYKPLIFEKIAEFKHPSPVTVQDHSRGNPAASVVVIEYSDFECPFCRRFHKILKEVQTETPFRWVYRHFPLDNHLDAARLAEASECASEQGKFWDFADTVFESPTPANWSEFLNTWALRAGNDATKFQMCVNNRTNSNLIQQAKDEGERLMISGTPTFFVNGKRNSGAISAQRLQLLLMQAAH